MYVPRYEFFFCLKGNKWPRSLRPLALAYLWRGFLAVKAINRLGRFAPSAVWLNMKRLFCPVGKERRRSLHYNDGNIIMLPCQRQQSVASEVTSNSCSVFADLTSGRKSTWINSYYNSVRRSLVDLHFKSWAFQSCVILLRSWGWTLRAGVHFCVLWCREIVAWLKSCTSIFLCDLAILRPDSTAGRKSVLY